MTEQVTDEDVQNMVRELRELREQNAKLVSTNGVYVAAVREFARWMPYAVAEHALRGTPLANVKGDAS